MKRRTQIAGAVAGLGTVAVIWLAATSLPELSQELTPVSTTPEELARRPVAAVASDITWTSGEGTLGGFGPRVGVWAEEGAFYVLSTAPGLREIPGGVPPPLSIYQSQDGFEWSSIPLAGLGEDLWARELAHANSLLYILGTAPAAADPTGVGMRVGVSADGGGTWDTQDLPIEVEPPAQALGGSGQTVQLAAGPAGALAAVSTSFFVDYSVLVPPEVLTPSSFVARTPEGLAVFDYSHMESLERACASGNQGACTQLANTAWEPNLRWSGTWEELGGEPAPDAFIEVYHAPPGGPFTEVETPFNTGYSLADLAAGADAFYAVGQIGGERFDRAAGVEVWRSVDGINWEERGGIPAVDRVVAMGAVGSETVLVGVRDNPGQVVVASTTNGTEWEVIDLAGLLPAAAQGGGQWVNAAAMG
ncbi:MAG TPA: hypothetical protein VJR05_13750, partial [Acidimicrobiia bacterium]|nr:hypothetical protein [Acidimicrobiia bacterium]